MYDGGVRKERGKIPELRPTLSSNESENENELFSVRDQAQIYGAERFLQPHIVSQNTNN